MYNLTNIHMLRLFNIENVLSQVADGVAGAGIVNADPANSGETN